MYVLFSKSNIDIYVRTVNVVLIPAERLRGLSVLRGKMKSGLGGYTHGIGVKKPGPR